MFNPRGYQLERQGIDEAYRHVNFTKQKSVLGRDEKTDINLRTSIVSRFHTLVEFVNGRMYIEDLKSANGTFLNGDKILQRTEVDENDLIGIGCNPKNHDPAVSRPDFLIYKAVLTPIVLLDSDEEEGRSPDNMNNDIDDLIDEMLLDSGITNAAVDEVIHVSSDEETEVDKNWKEKLSQERSPMPERLSAELRQSQLIPNIQILTPRPSPEPSLLQRSPPQGSSSNDTAVALKICECQVRVTRLSEVHIKQFTESSLNDPPEQLKNAMPSKREKLKSSSLVLKKSVEIVDNDSDTSADEPLKRKTNDTSKAQRRSVEDLECVRTDNPSKILIRRKSISTPPTSSTSKEPNKQSREPQTNKRKFTESILPAVSGRSLDKTAQKVLEKPMRKRRMTVCGTENFPAKVNRPPFEPVKPTPIIEAKRPKRRQSACSSEVDMFSVASNLRKDVQYKKTYSDDFKTAEEKEKAKKARAERLRQIAEDDDQRRKELARLSLLAKSDRIVPKIKVKITHKNRGDFLTNLPESKSVAKSTVKVATTKQPANPTRFGDDDDVVNPVLSSIADFRRKHVQRTVRSATVVSGICNNLQFYQDLDTGNVSNDTPLTALNSLPLELTENGPGFYNQIQFSQQPVSVLPVNNSNDQPEVSRPTLEVFVLPVTELRSILKYSTKHQTQTRRPRLNVQFPADDILTQVREFHEHETASPPQTDDSEMIERLAQVSVKLRRPSISVDEYKMKLSKRKQEASNDRQPLTDCVPLERVQNREPNLSVENQIIKRLLAWNPLWLQESSYFKPDSFNIQPMKMTYDSLQEYKATLRPIIELDLLANVINTYGRTLKKLKEHEWDSMVLEEVQASASEVTKLILISNETTRSYRQGSLLLLCTNKFNDQQDKFFFGYIALITGPMGEQSIIVDTMCNRSQIDSVTVIRSRQIMYVRAELKSMIALENLKETELVKNILNPSTIKPCDNYVSGVLVENPVAPLDDSQHKIVRKVAREMTTDAGIITIEGGPGTGKTKVIVASVLQIFLMSQKEKRASPNVLVCAMSNSCIDEIATFLQPFASTLGIRLLRTGNVGKLSESVLPFSLHFQAQCNRNGVMFKQAQTSLINNANVILTTVNSSSEMIEYGKKFSVCFIDEASQCTDADILIPLQLNFTKMVLVGDQNQLQPVVHSQALAKYKYDESLFERISNAFKNEEKKPVCKLMCQYRMHPEIFKFPNDNFYCKMIKSHSRSSNLIINPYMILNVESEQAMTQDTSPYNLSEVYFVSQLAEALNKILPKDFSIAIITPYTRQNNEIRKQLTSKNRIEVYTIDSSQGLEKDVVILSSTRTYGLGFLCNPRRLNVALTRAKQALYICGNFQSLQLNEVWTKMVTDAKERSVFHNVEDKIDEETLMSLIKPKSKMPF